MALAYLGLGPETAAPCNHGYIQEIVTLRTIKDGLTGRLRLETTSSSSEVADELTNLRAVPQEPANT